MALKATAPITFNPAKAQRSQKRQETLQLALKPVGYLPIRGNILAPSGCCAAGHRDILFLVLVTQLLYTRNPISLPIVLAEE